MAKKNKKLLNIPVEWREDVAEDYWPITGRYLRFDQWFKKLAPSGVGPPLACRGTLIGFGDSNVLVVDDNSLFRFIPGDRVRRLP